jgi:hypothetical protein
MLLLLWSLLRFGNMVHDTQMLVVVPASLTSTYSGLLRYRAQLGTTNYASCLFDANITYSSHC